MGLAATALIYVIFKIAFGYVLQDRLPAIESSSAEERMLIDAAVLVLLFLSSFCSDIAEADFFIATFWIQALFILSAYLPLIRSYRQQARVSRSASLWPVRSKLFLAAAISARVGSRSLGSR
jgi:hypothetical protein